VNLCIFLSCYQIQDYCWWVLCSCPRQRIDIGRAADYGVPFACFLSYWENLWFWEHPSLFVRKSYPLFTTALSFDILFRWVVIWFAATVCHNLVFTVATSWINVYKQKFSINYFFKYSLGFSDMKINSLQSWEEH